MTRSKFTFFNVVGAVIWVVGLTVAGYLFGNLPIVQTAPEQDHLGLDHRAGPDRPVRGLEGPAWLWTR
jgi:hypothetical protein